MPDNREDPLQWLRKGTFGDKISSTAKSDLVQSSKSAKEELEELKYPSPFADTPPFNQSLDKYEQERMPSSGDVFAGQYQITEKIGRGGYGYIFRAKEVKSGKEVALKVERPKARRPMLKMEAMVLKLLRGTKHSLKLEGCGVGWGGMAYMAMTLGGRNLSELRRETDAHRFHPSTAIRVSRQLLDAIANLHAVGYIHRDIKPSNFVIGQGSTASKIVYMVDFGFARSYRLFDGKHRIARKEPHFRGTTTYCSTNVLERMDQSRRDDLQSLVYVLVEFHRGTLPWAGISCRETVLQIKNNFGRNRLLEGLPVGISQFFDHIQTLGFAGNPDYVHLRKCLTKAQEKFGAKDSEPYEWNITQPETVIRIQGPTE